MYQVISLANSPDVIISELFKKEEYNAVIIYLTLTAHQVEWWKNITNTVPVEVINTLDEIVRMKDENILTRYNNIKYINFKNRLSATLICKGLAYKKGNMKDWLDIITCVEVASECVQILIAEERYDDVVEVLKLTYIINPIILINTLHNKKLWTRLSNDSNVCTNLALHNSFMLALIDKGEVDLFKDIMKNDKGHEFSIYNKIVIGRYTKHNQYGIYLIRSIEEDLVPFVNLMEDYMGSYSISYISKVDAVNVYKEYCQKKELYKKDHVLGMIKNSSVKCMKYFLDKYYGSGSFVLSDVNTDEFLLEIVRTPECEQLFNLLKNYNPMYLSPQYLGRMMEQTLYGEIMGLYKNEKIPDIDIFWNLSLTESNLEFLKYLSIYPPHWYIHKNIKDTEYWVSIVKLGIYEDCCFYKIANDCSQIYNEYKLVYYTNSALEMHRLMGGHDISTASLVYKNLDISDICEEYKSTPSDEAIITICEGIKCMYTNSYALYLFGRIMDHYSLVDKVYLFGEISCGPRDRDYNGIFDYTSGITERCLVELIKLDKSATLPLTEEGYCILKSLSGEVIKDLIDSRCICTLWLVDVIIDKDDITIFNIVKDYIGTCSPLVAIMYERGAHNLLSTVIKDMKSQ